MKRSLVAAALLGAGLLTALASSDPAGAQSARWRLDFEPGDFTFVVAGPASSGSGRAQYYLPYTVSNGTDSARRPRLRLEVRTETKKTFGDFYDADAYRAIAKDLRAKSVKSTAMLRGADLESGKSTSAAAHFGTMDDNADNLEVRVYGLWDPIIHDRRGKTWVENRVRVLKYRRYGDEYKRYLDQISLESTDDVPDGGTTELKKPE